MVGRVQNVSQMQRRQHEGLDQLLDVVEEQRVIAHFPELQRALDPNNVSAPPFLGEQEIVGISCEDTQVVATTADVGTEEVQGFYVLRVIGQLIAVLK